MHMEMMVLGAYQTNCYLVWGEDSPACVVLDPGYAPEEVLHRAETLGKRIEAILLTHGHFDHVGGVRKIAEATGCRVFICPRELEMPEAWTAGPLYYTDTYSEGDTVTLAGVCFRVYHTPGHTPGSVCLGAEDSLFSGDTLFWGSCGRTDLPGGSQVKILQSLRRLAGLDEDYTVYPGHGQKTRLSEERKYNPYLR